MASQAAQQPANAGDTLEVWVQSLGQGFLE